MELFASAAFASPIVGLTDDGATTPSMCPPARPTSSTRTSRVASSRRQYEHAIRPTGTLSPDILALNIAAPRASYIDDLASLVRVTRDSADGVAYLIVSDCDGNPIQHVEVVLSKQRSVRTFIAGASTVYGTAGATPVPVLVIAQADTADNGASGIFNIAPAAEYYLQAWGFRTQDETSTRRGRPRARDGVSRSNRPRDGLRNHVPHERGPDVFRAEPHANQVPLEAE